MTEAFRSFGVGSLLTVGGASLVVAALALRDARRSIEFSERRMEVLREEQTRLLSSFEEERRESKRDLERERELRLEAERRTERVHRELLLSRQARERLEEELKREREAREEVLRALRDAKRKARRSEDELQELRETERETERVRETASLVAPTAEAPSEGARRGSPEIPPWQARGIEAPPRRAGASEEAKPVAPKPIAPKPEQRPRRGGTRVPHPDEGAARTGRGGGPVEMFRKHYDKYLENYAGYLELAEGLYRARGGMTAGSFAEHEWEERLRRVRDGIRRTTARLDILEEHNPELATDARISQRAGLSRRHEELEEMDRQGR